MYNEWLHCYVLWGTVLLSYRNISGGIDTELEAAPNFEGVEQTGESRRFTEKRNFSF